MDTKFDVQLNHKESFCTSAGDWQSQIVVALEIENKEVNTK